MSVEIKGFAEIANQINKYKEGLQKELTAAIVQAGQSAFSDMQSNTPVRTGFLKSRWSFSPSQTGFTIENDCEYAAFVEFGTGNMQGRNFITPAYEQMRSDIDALIRQYSTKA